jgi:hypothetical protein
LAVRIVADEVRALYDVGRFLAGLRLRGVGDPTFGLAEEGLAANGAVLRAKDGLGADAEDRIAGDLLAAGHALEEETESLVVRQLPVRAEGGFDVGENLTDDRGGGRAAGPAQESSRVGLSIKWTVAGGRIALRRERKLRRCGG